MKSEILRKLFLGFIQIHILHHAKASPLYGSWMLEELKRHGYSISPGTLYPILHKLYRDGLLTRHDEIVEGKIRKYYLLTPEGEVVLNIARKKARELYNEIGGENRV